MMGRRAGSQNRGKAVDRVTSNRYISEIRISANFSRISSPEFYNRYKIRRWRFGRLKSPRRFALGQGKTSHLTLAFLAAISPSVCLAQKVPVTNLDSLPRECLIGKTDSEQISMLLESVNDHPTSGAYNTLGALFASREQIKCAIPAFQIALRLDAKNWEAHYNLALAFLHLGDTARGTDELHAAIREKPDSATSHFALGTLLYNQKKFAEAATEFDAVLKIDPNFPGATIGLAKVLTAQKNLPSAIALLETALAQPASDQGPNQHADQTVPLTIALALAYLQAGQTSKASEILEKLVANNPESAEPHIALGTLRMESQPPNLDGAISEFRTALQLDPEHDEARLALGRGLIAQGKFPEAVSPLKEYIAREPADPQGYYAAGVAYKGLQQWDPAAELLARAARLDPSNYDAHYELGLALAQSGRIEPAIRELKTAEEIRPSTPQVHAELARLLEKAGQNDLAAKERAAAASAVARGSAHSEAGALNAKGNELLAAGDARGSAAAYRQAIRDHPNNPELHYNLSLALEKLGDPAGEKQELEKAVRLDPQLAVAHNQLGILAMQSGQIAQSEAEFKKAISIDPRYADAQTNLGVLYSRAGKDSEALSLYQQAIASDPKYSRAYVNLGLLLAQNGRISEGEQQLRTAIQISPKDPTAYTTLGMIQARTGHGDEAVENFRKALELDPNSAQAHLNLGIALADQFDRLNGLKEFTEAARLDPRLPAVHYNLGRFYFETAKHDEARKELEETIRLDPDYVPALYLMALAAKQENDLERSTSLFEKVISLQPNNPDAQFLLGQNLEHQGKMHEAITHWKLALQADPNYSQALFNLARALRKTNDPQAQQYQDRYEMLQKNQQISDRVQQLGNFALEAANAQNWPQAFEQMHEALSLCGQCPEAAHLHKNLGMMYIRTGKLDDAQKELEAALHLDPNDGAAKQALAAIQNQSSGEQR